MNVPRDLVSVGYSHVPPTRRAMPWTELIPGIVLILDLVVSLLVAFICYSVLVDSTSYVWEYYLFAAGFVTLVSVLLFGRGGLYRIGSILAAKGSIDVALVATTTAFVFLLTILHALKTSALYQTDWLIAFAAGLILIGCPLRLAYGSILSSLVRCGRIGRRTAVLGTGIQAQRLLNRMAKSASNLSVVMGVYDPDAPLIGSEISGHPVSGSLSDLIDAARQKAFDDIVIALPEDAEAMHASVIERLRELPVDVYLAPSLLGIGGSLRPVQHANDLPLFEVWQRPISGWSSFLKIAEDYALALVALLLLTPALLIIAAAIRIDSGGPVLFRQKRLGFNNEIFEIFKFRTMEHLTENDGPVIQATRHDRRVTRVGRFLRRTSLDELPQLLNVLNGTMSLVGPRPHALNHNEDFARTVRGYFGRHKVKPGITGWAQVNGLRGEIDCQNKLEARVAHDVHYAENWSLAFDLRILLVTSVVVLFQRNAY